MVWKSREEAREYMRAYRQRPEVQEREKAWRAEYKRRPEVRERNRRPAPEPPKVQQLPAFRDAPPGSYVCEEGWLIVGDQAWTAEEWETALGADERKKYTNRYHSDDERMEARRRTKREHMQRVRARKRAA